MPARRIPKNYRNVTGITAARKAVGPAQFESTLERDFLTLLEFSPDVERFEVQPVTISWPDGARERRYTPDVLVHFRERTGERRSPMLYEVKYRSDLRKSWPELRPKFRAGIRHAKGRGWRFKIITEREIRTPYLANAQFLLPFVRRGTPPEAEIEILDRALQSLRECDIGSLMLAACHDEWQRAKLLPVLWFLIGRFLLGVDLQEPLTMRSRVWRFE